MDIFDHFQPILDAADALEVDGDGLVIEMEDIQEMKYAVMAMVLYSSRIEAKRLGWIIELETQGNQLFVQKVSANVQ